MNKIHNVYFLFTVSLFSDPELPKPIRPLNNFQKSKLSRIRASSLRQNRIELHNHSTYSADDWIVKSGCHFSCIQSSMGVQIISSKSDHSTNIQLCHAEFIVNIIYYQILFKYLKTTTILTDFHTD